MFGKLLRWWLCIVYYQSNKFVVYKKVKFSRYRPGVVQRVGIGIALLFHDRGTRRGWVVSSTPRPHFSTGKDTVPILQEAGWAAGPVWTGGKSRPRLDSIPDRPARSQSLYRLSYPAHNFVVYMCLITVLSLGAVGFIFIKYFVGFYLLLCYTCGLFVECAFERIPWDLYPKVLFDFLLWKCRFYVSVYLYVLWPWF